MLRKQVEFDVPGGAKFDAEEMHKRVQGITKDIYNVDIETKGVDLQNYYRKDGAKITKSLTSLLRRELPKEEVASRFSSYGRTISDLYTVGLRLTAVFGAKEKLGNGEYEGSATCFRDGGEHEKSKSLLIANSRCKAVILYKNGSKTPLGRCIAYFAGGRNIFLTNFYFKNISPNKLYFITAVRHLVGLKKVQYRYNPRFFLPIYRNGDAVHIYDERSTFPSPYRKITCPVCLKRVPAVLVHAGSNGRDHNIVSCSPECAAQMGRRKHICGRCKARYSDEEVVTIGGRFPGDSPRARYCFTCAPLMTELCMACGGRFDPKIMEEKHGMKNLCPPCASAVMPCSGCKEVHVSGAGLHSHGNKVLCRKCLLKAGRICELCNAVIATKKPITVGGRKIVLCGDCSEPIPGTKMAAEMGK